MIKNLFLLIISIQSILFCSEISLTKMEKEYLSNKKVLNLCIDPSWMPYEEIENGKHIGMTADYIKVVEKYLDIEIKLVQTDSWSESLEYGKQRKCDMFSLIMPTTSRLEYLDFTNAYFDIPLVITTAIHELFIDDLSLLNDKNIGIVKDYAYTEILKIKYPKINLIYVDNVSTGLKKLSKGEYFAFIGTFYTIGYQIQNDYVGKLKIAGKFDEKWELGFASRNDEPLLKSILNKAILSVPNEEKQEIFNKWLSIKYEKNYYKFMIGIIFTFVIIIIAILLMNRKLSSEVKKKEEAEKLLKLTITSAKLGTWQWNPKTNKNVINDLWAEIIGYKKEEISSSFDIFASIHPEDISSINDSLEKHAKAEALHYEAEFRMLCKNGKYKWIYSNGAIVERDINGNAELIVGIHLDIDERKKLELEVLKQKDLLIQKSRQAAMGEMLENIAHQWRQPLSLITTVASGLKIGKKLNTIKEGDIDNSMDQIIKSGMYLSQTIDDFRGYLNKNKTKSDVNIKKLIENASSFYTSEIKKENINLVLNIDDCIISTYENELLQCILNILSNAVDVLKEIDINHKCIIINVYENQNKCNISIKDNGLGIKKENLLKIFEPYFTTKHKAQGTGIGLYMTHEIITKHLFGNIDVANVNFKYLNEEVSGAYFSIILPKKIDEELENL